MNIKKYLEDNEETLKPWLTHNEQGRIDLKILPYLQDIENGVFVEAGALDGLFMSNTKLLEDLGWTGVLIEPSKPAYDKCVQNRDCFIENCALVSFDNKDDFVVGDFIHNGHQGLGARSKIMQNGVKVQAKTLTEVLSNLDITHVDLFSLDVEGYELEVLDGIDFNTINITYILIEVNTDDYSLAKLDSLLLSKGFENIRPISNFNRINVPTWPGNHQDYLYKRIS
jgi:FkbM family methyltransferase